MSEITSRHLRNASELLVMAPIKQGFVETAEMTLSYASRLRLLLSGLYDMRRIAAERELAWMAGPIEQLRTISNSQWTVLPDDRHLLVTVTFDRSWEEYFQLLVKYSGPSLDLIFCHCEGYADNTCVAPDGTLRYQGFSDWVRRHQIACDFYYAANPDLTSDDVEYLRKLAAEPAPSAEAAAELTLGSLELELFARQRAAVYPAVLAAASKLPGLTSAQRAAQAEAFVQKGLKDAALSMTRQALTGIEELRRFFPPAIEPDRQSEANLRPAQDLFDLAVCNLLPLARSLSAEQTPLDGWIAKLKQVQLESSPNPRSVALPAQALHDIQGNILEPYEHMTHGCVVLLRCDDPDSSRMFLTAMAAKVTTSHDQQGSSTEGPFGNLAVTYAGLERLGVAEPVLRSLPKEFRDGMESRAGALGDVGHPNHPDYWQLPRHNWHGAGQALAEDAEDTPVPLASVDFVVMFQVRQPDQPHDWLKHPLRGFVEKLEPLGAHVLHVQLLERHSAGGGPLEHFGFVDGISQPVPDATLDTRVLAAANRDRVALGEVLLGYPDNRNEVAWCADAARDATAARLFRNGSFLVLRKLEQDVEAFNTYAASNTIETESQSRVKEWTLGRALDTSVPLADAAATDNDFDYTNDKEGRKCPFHAHIRRANPRDVDAAGRGRAPRIVRRGFSYGPRYDDKPDAARGLLFMAYNASIAGQYEVIQRWLNGGNSVGILSAQNDLFTGSPQPGAAPHWVYGAGGWRALTPAPQSFVSVRWGLYTFVPSRTGLETLAKVWPPAATGQESPLVSKGRQIIESLLATEAREGKEVACVGWRSIIEEPTNTERAAALWAAIREQRGGVMHTPYGVLVASESAAAEVLEGDGQLFSVREYWHRLKATTGEHYLALDPRPGKLAVGDAEADTKHATYEARLQHGPGYTQLGGPADGLILEAFADGAPFGREKTFVTARELARDLCEQNLAAAKAAGKSRVELELKALATWVVAQLSRTWFGLPAVAVDSPNEATALAEGVMPFALASQFSFQPYPGAALGDAARAAGAAVRGGTRLLETDLSRKLRKDPAYTADATVFATMAGSVVGFAAPAIASVLTVVDQWIATQQLPQRIEAWNAAPQQEWLEAAVRAALSGSPIPPILYRTAMAGATIGGKAIEPGSMVVVGLGSAVADRGDQNWLFGGARTVNPHACPARATAIASVAGIIAALLECSHLYNEHGSTFSFGAKR